MLILDCVHTYYGHIHALKGVSLTVNEGEIVSLIGSNGAGKTTTLNTISGVLKARAGAVYFQDNPRQYRGTRRRTAAIVTFDWTNCPRMR